MCNTPYDVSRKYHRNVMVVSCSSWLGPMRRVTQISLKCHGGVMFLPAGRGIVSHESLAVFWPAHTAALGVKDCRSGAL